MPATPSSHTSLRSAGITASLRLSRLFADLPTADLEAVAAGCSVRSLDKGATLFREGERAEGFFVVQSGRISVHRLTPAGEEQIICVFQAPESFAEVVLATTETYPANAVAIEPSQVLLVHKTHFRELVCRKPELALRMLASMSMHLKFLVQTIHDIKGRRIEARLADWLLQQAPPAGKAFELPMTKRLLAGQLGVTGETLSRTLARFRKEGLIAVSGPQLQVLNLAGLRAYQTG